MFEAVWRSWLRHPDDERWTVLTRWRVRPISLTDAVLAAAIEPDRPAAQRKAIGAFCARHGLAPAGEVERTLFRVLTGQLEQHRAADPDGALLVAAYQAADQAARSALREALAAAGDLTLVRTLAVSARSLRAAPLTAEERRHLVGQLATRADWDGLWRLALDLPLADAVAATRSFPGGWRPRNEEGRQLLARLASSRPEAVTAVADAAVTRISQDNYHLRGFDFSPDGSQITVALLEQARCLADRLRSMDVQHARASRTWSGRPANVALSRTATPAIAHRPSPAVRPWEDPGAATRTKGMGTRLGGKRQARAPPGTHVKRLPIPLPGPDSRPLRVRGHRNNPPRSDTR